MESLSLLYSEKAFHCISHRCFRYLGYFARTRLDDKMEALFCPKMQLVLLGQTWLSPRLCSRAGLIVNPVLDSNSFSLTLPAGARQASTSPGGPLAVIQSIGGIYRVSFLSPVCAGKWTLKLWSKGNYTVHVQGEKKIKTELAETVILRAFLPSNSANNLSCI